MSVADRLRALRAWAIRCAPALSNLAFILLIACALVDCDAVHRRMTGRPPAHAPKHAPSARLINNYSYTQLVFFTYSFWIHIAALAFTVRLCRAALHTSIRLENARKMPLDHFRLREKADDDLSPSDDDSLTLCGDQPEDDDVADFSHAIILPSYKEDIHTLEDTLKVLASHRDARSCYHIVLAMESRDPDGVRTSESLIQTFTNQFQKMEYTLHPADIAGEAAGKSSNVGWAAHHLMKSFEGNRENMKNVVVTVMDCDTHLSTRYFSLIRSKHVENRGAMTLYVPPLVFDRNAHEVPRLVRVADLMWSGACLSTFEEGSSITLPTSVYSLPLSLVHLVGGWDTGPEAIGEDLHMALKCYFGTNGKLNIEQISSAASQCNIGGGPLAKGGLRGWLTAHQSRYNQGLRHMWGALDTGYAINQWIDIGKPGRSIRCLQRSRKPSQTETDLKLSQLDTPSPRRLKLTWRNFVLFNRLYEAHFLPSHLVIILISSTMYENIVGPNNNLPLLWFFFQFTNGLRLLSFFIMIFYFVVFYERYHAVCVDTREEEMKAVGLYEQFSDSFSHRSLSRWQTWVDYFVFPIGGTIFGSLPAVHATCAHFFTTRLTYVVSIKPQSQRPVAQLV